MRARIIALLTLAVVAACAHKDATAPSSSPCGSSAVDVYTIGQNIFSPFSSAVAVGGTVCFHIGEDGIAHDVNFESQAGAPAFIPVSSHVTVPRTFTVKGTFPFHCYVHPGMDGQIVVQ